MVIWAPKEMSRQPQIMGATASLAPPQPPNAPGPFALSSPGVVDSVLEGAGGRVVNRGNQSVVLEYPNVESACRAAMAGSGAVRAIQHSGEARVRQAILEALSPFRTEAGSYRMHNTFHYLIAKKIPRADHGPNFGPEGLAGKGSLYIYFWR